MDQPKDCPVCRLVNHPSALRCDCGYDFEAQRVLATYLTNKQAAQAAETEQRKRALPQFLKLINFFTGWFRSQ